MNHPLRQCPRSAPWLLPLLVTACQGTSLPPPAITLPLCAAPPTSDELTAELRDLPLAERERHISAWFARGALPTALRQLCPVTTTATLAGRTHTATFWCTPDVFGLGRDDDWLRLPITPQLAERFAAELDCVLPTRVMVDAIWRAAAVQTTPVTFDPRVYDITALERFAAHDAAIDAQLVGVGPGALVAGHKKDVIASALRTQFPQRVVIYGWHRPDGTPIQPRSKVHGTGHVDYSHGVRFVARRVLVDGRWSTIDAVLADPELHALLSDEGPLGR
ncbi:MAG: hypothetical protein MUC36_00500 [Planctomycetes bacterium]|nr:hypothetical protein [Planctomycetota bacterium]